MNSIHFYDQPGCGKSERPDNTTLWQRNRFVEELHQIRQALNEQSAHMPHLEEMEHYLQTVRNFLRRVE